MAITNLSTPPIKRYVFCSRPLGRKTGRQLIFFFFFFFFFSFVFFFFFLFSLGVAEALGLGDGVTVNPSGGALCGNPMFAAGLARIGMAAQVVMSGQAQRALGHATSGPALQQNLVCVLEAQ